MLTKAQYKFLKHVRKEAKKFGNSDNVSRHFNKKRVPLEKFATILSEHKDLSASNPFNYKKDDELSGCMLSSCIDIYLGKMNISEYVVFESSGYYSTTPKGDEMIEQYSTEKWCKIRLPLIAIIISILALALSIISLAIKFIP